MGPEETSLLPAPSPSAKAALATRGAPGFVRHALARIGHYAREPQAPPARSDRLERLFYGAAHPLLGLRLLWRDPELRREALVPVFWMALICAVVAFANTDAESPTVWVDRLKHFYRTFAWLAPVPSVLFANHYARMAALTRWRLGLGACGPREQPLSTLIKRLLQQAVLVAATLLPLTVVLRVLPFGRALTNLVLGAWALHWVVVEAFDDARVLQPGETLAQAEGDANLAPRPWFVRTLHGLADRLPPRFTRTRRAANAFARFIDGLSKPWREEISLLEKNPFLAGGFALATAGLLATPVLNLLFRPAIIAGSSNLLAHLEKEEAEDRRVAREADAARSLDAAALGPPAPAGGVEDPFRPQPLRER